MLNFSLYHMNPADTTVSIDRNPTTPTVRVDVPITPTNKIGFIPKASNLVKTDDLNINALGKLKAPESHIFMWSKNNKCVVSVVVRETCPENKGFYNVSVYEEGREEVKLPFEGKPLESLKTWLHALDALLTAK